MFDAILLAGGGARLGGADKPGLEVGEISLLDRVVAAVAGTARIVVVGPERPLGVAVICAARSLRVAARSPHWPRIGFPTPAAGGTIATPGTTSTASVADCTERGPHDDESIG